MLGARLAVRRTVFVPAGSHAVRPATLNLELLTALEDPEAVDELCAECAVAQPTQAAR
jgi:hypothetical protein